MDMAADEAPNDRCEVFWGEMAPCDHVVQIYREDGAFLDALERFVAAGLYVGEGVILIATADHLRALDRRLRAMGLDLDRPSLRDQYITLDAERVLAMFMLNGWPDDFLFDQIVTSLLDRAGRGGRRVRAFGEMVALLWSQGNSAATIRLEHLWNRVCREKGFSLFCAYPRTGFTQGPDESMREICAAHSRVIAG